MCVCVGGGGGGEVSQVCEVANNSHVMDDSIPED